MVNEDNLQDQPAENSDSKGKDPKKDTNPKTSSPQPEGGKAQEHRALLNEVEKEEAVMPQDMPKAADQQAEAEDNIQQQTRPDEDPLELVSDAMKRLDELLQKIRGYKP